MKQKSNVVTGKFLIIALFPVAFHFCSLMMHSSTCARVCMCVCVCRSRIHPHHQETKSSREQYQMQFNDIFYGRQDKVAL